ncbi:MAG: N-acetylmuramoyl-L-alanine amidase [Dehalococcoidia bacterium]|nr:N-acetylmuramoyl-L-alanine amidase [Dehalococcoidia bacterium]
MKILRVWRCFGAGHSLPAVVGVAAVVALLALACSSPAANTSGPLPSPIVYAEEPETPTPQPAATAPDQPPENTEHEPSAMPVSPSLTPDEPRTPTAANVCSDQPVEPLPRSGGAGSQGSWGSFRTPLPPAPVWNPPGPKTVGLQAGHWLTNEVPKELAGLAGSGTSWGGHPEWEVTLDLAQRAASILESYGVQVDVLPATIPPGYRAHAFVAIHTDGDLTGSLTGFKVARPGFSSIPSTDDMLVDALNAEYGPVTGLQRKDTQISLRMLYYYAFNSRRYCHSVAPGAPSAIIETGFLTNASDRTLLLGSPDTVALGIARGVMSFLGVLDGPAP